MSDNQESLDKSDERNRRLQRNKTDNEDPTVTSLEEQETGHYEKGKGGATD
jgi:hypothetical protein